MAITDELRKEAQGNFRYLYTSGQEKHLLAIADRIDAAHEEALVSSYFDGVFSDEELAENGFIRLPKDADGEYIHIGDVMEWMPHDKTYQPVIRIVSGVGADVFFAWSGANCQYGQYDAQAFRHHKQPTVEDVLREFARDFDAWRNYSGPANESPSNPVAEYAAKLRLAGEGE